MAHKYHSNSLVYVKINLLKVILLHVIFSALKLCTKMVPTLPSLSPYFDIEGFPYKMSQFYFKWSGRSPGEGNGNLLQFFLPAEFHGQRSLEDQSPGGHKQSETTEGLALSLISQ